VLNLSSRTDPDVFLDTTLHTDFGLDTAGTVVGTALLTDVEEAELLSGQYYLNIHSFGFTAGELRGNLVPAAATGVTGAVVPEPASLSLVAAGVLTMLRRRRA